MRTRYALAAAFVVVVAALIAVRDAGFLGGRADGGPLELSLAADGALRYELEGGPVDVQDVRFRFVSAGATVIGPTIEGGDLLEDARVEPGEGGGAVRLRARRRGVYYALGGTVDYRRGQRRYRTPMGGACVAVRLGAECAGYDGPGDAEVAEMGGPSRYEGASFDGATAVFKGDAAALRITLTSRRRGGVEVARLTTVGDVRLRASSPVAFRLPPLGTRSLFLRLAGCGRLEALEAELDGEVARIPLSLPVELRCRRGGG